MAYEKQTWTCGDTITADKLNHIEDGIANVDVGYSCLEERTTLTDESVTTTVEDGNSSAIGELTSSEQITADTIKVTFNGTEYTCNKRLGDGENLYGAEWSDATESFDFSIYPFEVFSEVGYNHLVTETAGTYQVKIEAFEETVETSECFDKAVHSISRSEPLKVSINNEDSLFDKTWQEIHDAFPNVYVEEQTGGNTNHYAITTVSVSPNAPRPYSIVFASSPTSVYTALTPTSYPAAGDR